MTHETYTYTFVKGIDLGDVQDTLMLAIVAAEGVYGAARVRMDAKCRLDEQARTVVVDAATTVGRHINRVFTNFLVREFGGDAFEVRRTTGPCPHEAVR